ncbi:CaiB/BaiF CoA-transferase family protein [uncultured Ferrimonas sp.]|uniref:CaiB/BaiF CoA transferase family protein n=1 Tax=uncultured Ferrimonas sp. TaxID=432640 RepID=UPI00261C7ADA|nr:CaiB/BaiF CoA-transferase family protein [uncultured Ferrimonas sp.]
MGPLQGITVIEMAGIGPTPFAGMALADLGAKVILIERKHASNNAAAGLDQRGSNLFHRGKQALALDLKQPESVPLVRQLLAQADVLIEGFRPGVMERLGLGPDIALGINPKLIYGRLTGYGQTGPLAQMAGHEPNYTGLSGALYYGGRPAQGAQPRHAPSAPLTSMGDVGGGSMVLIMGILSALLHVKNGGPGQVIDSAISDGSAYISTLMWSLKQIGHIDSEFGHGWADGAAPWNQTYCCADGRYVAVCALEPQFYQALLQGLQLNDDPLLQQQWDRRHWSAATARLSALFASQPQAHWCDRFAGTDACLGPVLDFEQAQAHPHNQARGTFVSPNGVSQPAPAPQFSATPTQAGTIPQHGQHNQAILAQLGLTPAEIAALQQQGVC